MINWSTFSKCRQLHRLNSSYLLIINMPLMKLKLQRLKIVSFKQLRVLMIFKPSFQRVLNLFLSLKTYD
jgi:hypothetical protein